MDAKVSIGKDVCTYVIILSHDNEMFYAKQYPLLFAAYWLRILYDTLRSCTQFFWPYIILCVKTESEANETKHLTGS